MSAQKQHPPDDEQRNRPPESAKQPDTNTHREGEREVGDEGEEKGSEPPRGQQDQTAPEQAQKRQERMLEDGSELPG